MCHFRKDTPHTRRNKAQKRIDKLCNKRDRLDNYHRWDYNYDKKRKRLNRKIAGAIGDRNFAESEIRHPKPVPRTVIDNSRRVFAPKVGIKIGNNDNTATANISGHYHSGRKSTSKKSSKRTKNNSINKVKLVFALIGIACLIGLTIFATVRINNCVNAKKTAYSNPCAIFETISA